MNIKHLLENGREQPYHIPLKVQVVKKAETRHYQNDGKDRNATSLGLADATDAMLCICYDENKLEKLTEGSNVMIRNFILREKKIVITSQTLISKTASVGDIPANITQKAIAAVQPSDSTRYTVAGTKTVGMGQSVSVTAKVTRVDEKTERTLTKTKEKVDFRTVTLKDNSGEINLSLWRQFASKEFLVGRFYNIANVRTSIYNNVITLNSSYNTRLEVVETPTITEYYLLEGYDTEQDIVHLVCSLPGTEDYKDFSVDKDKLVALVGDDEELDNLLLPMLPLSVKITAKENDSNVIAITV